jgi:5-methyltetrahydropteroyltriglutamate--homocysteine methyltransferase
MTARYRAEHVGSLLRPQAVLEAAAAYAKGELPLEQLREVEDAAILGALQLQREVGLDIVTDGEYRRAGWSGDFAQAVDGYVPGALPIAFEWRLMESRAQEQGTQAKMPPRSNTQVIGGRLKQKRRLTEHEAPFLQKHAGKPFKVTTPAASYNLARGWKPGVSDQVYSSRRELALDIAGIVNNEVKALAAEGVPYIQIDNPHYPDYIEDYRLDQWRAIGVDPDQALLEDIEADNAAVAGLDRSRTVIATHLCRGNSASAWHTSGGYDRIAERVFGGLDTDIFLLEYDTDRAGGFEPLRFVPKGRVVVLGLLTSKVGELESQDELRKRIDEAAKYVPLENLALSPQCGFASVSQGNRLSWDEQRQKLELVVDTARKVWG